MSRTSTAPSAPNSASARAPGAALWRQPQSHQQRIRVLLTLNNEDALPAREEGRTVSCGMPWRIRFGADIFNVLNQPNFASPSAVLTDNSFGISRSMMNASSGSGNASTGRGYNSLYTIGGLRAIQMALKLVFWSDPSVCRKGVFQSGAGSPGRSRRHDQIRSMRASLASAHASSSLVDLVTLVAAINALNSTS